jgi:hypothetical protein
MGLRKQASEWGGALASKALCDNINSNVHTCVHANTASTASDHDGACRILLLVLPAFASLSVDLEILRGYIMSLPPVCFQL